MGVAVADGAPRLPGDPHDQDADAEADQRVGDRQETTIALATTARLT
jgi:hypothetical protein